MAAPAGTTGLRLGRVTSFDATRGLGSVTDDTGEVHAFHATAIADGTRRIDVKMTLTAPGCGMGDILVDDATEKIRMIPTVSETKVELVFDPPWNQSMMTEAARLQTGMF